MQKKVWKKPQKNLRKRKSKIYKEEKESGENFILWLYAAKSLHHFALTASCRWKTNAEALSCLLSADCLQQKLQGSSKTSTQLKAGSADPRTRTWTHRPLCRCKRPSEWSDSDLVFCRSGSTCSLKVLVNTVNMGCESESRRDENLNSSDLMFSSDQHVKSSNPPFSLSQF